MSAYSRVHDLIEIILHSVAEEARVVQLSVEVESVITRGVLEAYGRGKADAKEDVRDTSPPPSQPPPPRSMPQTATYRNSVYPPGAAGPTKPPPRRQPTPPMFSQPPASRPRIPTPKPRKYDPRRDD